MYISEQRSLHLKRDAEIAREGVAKAERTRPGLRPSAEPNSDTTRTGIYRRPTAAVRADRAAIGASTWRRRASSNVHGQVTVSARTG